MNKFETSVQDAKGHVKYARNAVHAFGMRNPFTLATITAIIAFVAGALIF